MTSGLISVEYREGSTVAVEYMTQDLDAIKTAFCSYLRTGTPEFVEVERRDLRTRRAVIIRLSTVRAIEFSNLRA
jgi:hypothetical protein